MSDFDENYCSVTSLKLSAVCEMDVKLNFILYKGWLLGAKRYPNLDDIILAVPRLYHLVCDAWQRILSIKIHNRDLF